MIFLGAVEQKPLREVSTDCRHILANWVLLKGGPAKLGSS